MLRLQKRSGRPATTDWPFQVKFVYCSGRWNCGGIAPSAMFHSELLKLVARDIELQDGIRFEFTNDEAFMGEFEWEEDGTFSVVVTWGGALPEGVRAAFIDVFTLLKE